MKRSCNKNRIIVTDLLCGKYDHINVNHRYLRHLDKLFEIYGVFNVQHAETLRVFHGALELRNKPLPCLPSRSKFNQLFNTLYLLIFIVKCPASFIVVLSSNSFQQLIIKVFNLAIRKKIYFVLHGEINQLIQEPKGIIRVHWVLPFLTSKYIVYIANTLRIKRELLNIYPRLRQNMVDIQLPYTQQIDHNSSLIRSPGPLRVSSFGLYSVDKGSHYFGELVELVADANSEVVFNYIGKLHTTDEEVPTHQAIKLYPSADGYSFDVYKDELVKADIVVLFYPPDFLKLGTSAAAMDALLHGKTLFYLDNAGIADLAEIVGGEARAFKSVKEMADAVIESSWCDNTWRGRVADVCELYKRYDQEVERKFNCVF